MQPSIPLVGLSPGDPTPGNYLEVNFAAGEVSSGGGVYSILIIGGMLSSGTATADTVIYGPDTSVQMASEADVIALFGDGSEVHRMWRRITALNLSTPIYAIAVSEGSLASAAGATIALSGPATSAGAVRVFIGDEFVDAGFATGDSATTIAANVATAMNSRGHWAVTATPSSSNILVTAKQKGPRGNFIRYFALVLPSSSGIAVTPTASTAMSGGATADSNATALTTIAAQRFYYIVSAAEDATQLGALVSQVNTAALAVTGIRQRVFGGAVNTLSSAVSVATSLNAARCELSWLAGSDVPPAELAANAAAVYALEEAPRVPRCNFSSYGNDAKTSGNWKIKAPLSGLMPTRGQIMSALNAGLTPIGVLSAGRTYLVKRVTTRFLNGSNPDYRIRDAHKVTICDRFADDLKAKEEAQLAGKNIGDDPVKNEEPNPNTVTPRVYNALILRLIRDYGELGLLQRVNEIVAGTKAIREANPATRLSAQIPLQPVDILDQTAAQINQVA